MFITKEKLVEALSSGEDGLAFQASWGFPRELAQQLLILMLQNSTFINRQMEAANICGVSYIEYGAENWAIKVAEKLSDTVKEKQALQSQWFPILGFLINHPEILDLKVGESISEKLLTYLKEKL